MRRSVFAISTGVVLLIASIAIQAQTAPTTPAAAPTTRSAAAVAFERWVEAAGRGDVEAARALMIEPRIVARRSGGPMQLFDVLGTIRRGEYGASRVRWEVVRTIEQDGMAAVVCRVEGEKGSNVAVMPMLRRGGEWKLLWPVVGLEEGGLVGEQAKAFRGLMRDAQRVAAGLAQPLTPEQRDARQARMDRQKALADAVLAGDVEKVKAAIAGGAAPEQDFVGGLLGTALQKGQDDVAAALRAGGARPHAGWVRYWIEEAPDPGAIRRALDLGLDPNEAELSGDGMRTSLMHAVQGGDLELVDRMIARGGRIVDSPELATTYLNAAAASGVGAMVERVLAAGVDPRRVDGFGETPLHAVAFGPVDNLIQPARREGGQERAAIVRRLLRLGVDSHARVAFPRKAEVDTALLIAADRQRSEVIVALLEARGYEPAELSRVLALAVPGCDGPAIAGLVAQGARVEDAGRAGEDAVHRAITGRCDPAVVATLLGHGGLLESTGRVRRTPLHEAIARGNAATVRLLLDRGASLNARDARGHDAQQLMVARIARGREYGDREELRYVEEFDADGFVPADVAEMAGLLSVPVAQRPTTRPAAMGP